MIAEAREGVKCGALKRRTRGDHVLGLTRYYNKIIIQHMTQKVLQIGSSAGITLSKDALKALGLRIGDQVKVELNQKKNGLVILPLRPGKDEAEFNAWTEKFLKQYGPALKALAKK